MIRLTRLNGKEFVVNAEMIQFVETTPDTVITLLSNEKIVVREGVDVVVERVIVYGRQVRTPAGP